jgi:4-amino-4-deoxy-L-arabinose transferase-like glycosyltransferase
LVNRAPTSQKFFWTLLPCAIVLVLAAWLRGAEYDEQYTLFLTAGLPRPDWPATVFPAGLARQIQAGHATWGDIARDLRVTDVHPPLYFWLVSLWRWAVGPGLFEARLFSVVLGVGALALVGVIARVSRLPPVWAMLLTLGCYGFTYTSMVARGFALAQLLLLGGVAAMLSGRRLRHFLLAGVLFGAATLSNYLAVFTVGACLLAIALEALWPRRDPGTTFRQALAVLAGFLVFIPGDLWWYLAQRGSRTGQFPPFSLSHSLARLAIRFSGNILGGIPLYVHGIASMALTAALGLLLLGLITSIVWRWRRIATPRTRLMFGLAVMAPIVGLLLLGMLFNNTPIEVRYLTFSTPFAGLLLAGAPRPRGAAALLTVQAASIAGLMLAPQTMQPAGAAAHAAAALVLDGIVLLPRGNDGVGVVGAFAIESPPALPLLLIPAGATPEQIRTRIGPWHRVVLALLEQDDSSRAASEAMRRALISPDWREVARGPNVAVYERVVAVLKGPL